MSDKPTMVWWGRFDPEYSRNRIVRKLLKDLGWTLHDFHPISSVWGNFQATIEGIERPDVLWVPCFRQRDLKAAVSWAGKRNVPVIFDPLISAYDKQVEERRKLKKNGRKANRLLRWERALFSKADLIVADTEPHASYFNEVLGVPRERLSVLMVGAEEALFQPCPQRAVDVTMEVLFFGSFIPLQGPEIIVEAARRCAASNVQWTFLGEGPLRSFCEQSAQDLSNVRFEDWVPYTQLPERICRADVLLGIFGQTPKAGRVIPNKFYQALACGKPVITRSSHAYPEGFGEAIDTGVFWVSDGGAEQLAGIVDRIAANPSLISDAELHARVSFERWFSLEQIRNQLRGLLGKVKPS